jgi:hypothetical protein
MTGLPCYHDNVTMLSLYRYHVTLPSSSHLFTPSTMSSLSISSSHHPFSIALHTSFFHLFTPCSISQFVKFSGIKYDNMLLYHDNMIQWLEGKSVKETSFYLCLFLKNRNIFVCNYLNNRKREIRVSKGTVGRGGKSWLAHSWSMLQKFLRCN